MSQPLLHLVPDQRRLRHVTVAWSGYLSSGTIVTCIAKALRKLYATDVLCMAFRVHYSASQLQHLCFIYRQDNGNGAAGGTFRCDHRSDRRPLHPVSNSDEIDRLKTETIIGGRPVCTNHLYSRNHCRNIDFRK